MVSVLVLVTVAFFPATWPLSEGSLGPVLPWLLIVKTQQVAEYLDFIGLAQTLRLGEIWRLWTPALLHFSVLHLAFNLLWLWEFGRRIEIGEGGRRLLSTVLVVAPIANLAQYLWAVHGPEGRNTILFGGMSGVVYGLLGYVVTAWRRARLPAYRVHAGLVVALLVLLVVLSFGVTEPFGLHIANAAHWGGLGAGIAWATLRVPRSAPPRAASGEPANGDDAASRERGAAADEDEGAS